MEDEFEEKGTPQYQHVLKQVKKEQKRKLEKPQIKDFQILEKHSYRGKRKYVRIMTMTDGKKYSTIASRQEFDDFQSGKLQKKMARRG